MGYGGVSVNEHDEGNGNVLQYRVNQVFDWVTDLKAWRVDVDKDRTLLVEHMKSVHEDIREMRDALQGIKKAILTFAATVGASVLGVALDHWLK